VVPVVGLRYQVCAGQETAIDGSAYRARRMRETVDYRVAPDNQQVALWRAALARQASVADCDALIIQGVVHGRPLTMRMALAAKALCKLEDDSTVSGILAEMSSRVSAQRVGLNPS
jgi:hypothetical protein